MQHSGRWRLGEGTAAGQNKGQSGRMGMGGGPVPPKPGLTVPPPGSGLLPPQYSLGGTHRAFLPAPSGRPSFGAGVWGTNEEHGVEPSGTVGLSNSSWLERRLDMAPRGPSCNSIHPLWPRIHGPGFVCPAHSLCGQAAEGPPEREGIRTGPQLPPCFPGHQAEP